jgi:uncharacterized paraquat-inducible protein A
MNSPNKSGNSLVTGVICLIAAAAVAPAVVSLASALLPLVIVLAIAALILRLVFFHTRNW